MLAHAFSVFVRSWSRTLSTFGNLRKHSYGDFNNGSTGWPVWATSIVPLSVLYLDGKRITITLGLNAYKPWLERRILNPDTVSSPLVATIVGIDV